MATTKEQPYLVSINSRGFSIHRRRSDLKDAPNGFVAGGETLGVADTVARTQQEYRPKYDYWIERHNPADESSLAYRNPPTGWMIFSANLEIGVATMEGQVKAHEEGIRGLLKYRDYDVKRSWWIEPLYDEEPMGEPIQLIKQTCDSCGNLRLTRRLPTSIIKNGIESSAVFLCHECWGREMGWRIYRNTDVTHPFEVYGFFEQPPPRSGE